MASKTWIQDGCQRDVKVLVQAVRQGNHLAYLNETLELLYSVPIIEYKILKIVKFYYMYMYYKYGHQDLEKHD